MLLLAALLATTDVDTPIQTGARAPADAAALLSMAAPLRLPPDPFARHDGDAAAAALIHTRGVAPWRIERVDGARDSTCGTNAVLIDVAVLAEGNGREQGDTPECVRAEN